MNSAPDETLHLAIPKGRMFDGVVKLLSDAGIRIAAGSRGYRPQVSVPGFEAKILKPQNIIEMLHSGTRDVGFAGADWVAELQADLVPIVDTGLDQVRLVAAAPAQVLEGGRLPRRALVVAGEYQHLTTRWIDARGVAGDRFVRSYGATEVFPPEDADCIVDIAASGATLEANGLRIAEEIMRSSTMLYASQSAMADPRKSQRIGDLAMLIRSVIEARGRVMLELNVPEERLEAVVQALPCMRRPTLSALAGGGYAVKAVVPRDQLPMLIPTLKLSGGSDIVISPIAQVVP